MKATLLLSMCALAGCMAGPGDRAVGSLSQAATMCPAGATVNGIDVSSYQATVDWAKVAASGRVFGIAKATEGTGLVDSSFANNWSEMPKHGLLRSAYHFFHPSEDPVAQAKFFVKTMGPLGPGDLPPMLDLEVTDGVAAATVVSRALTWLTTVEQMTGKRPIVYTYPDFFQNQIGAPSGFDGYPLNIANYGVQCPNVVGTWKTWTMWQYSSTGKVPGVTTGDCDEDQFNGDLNALKMLATSNGVPNPCLGLTDGTYCGGDGIVGDQNTLFVCGSGQVASMTPCAAGCKYNPPGTPDECNPVPDGGSTVGDDGGAPPNSDGGGGLPGDAIDAGGGGPKNGATKGGCAFAGPSTAHDGAAALALLALFALALLRRRGAC